MLHKIRSMVSALVIMSASSALAADNYTFNLKVPTGASSCIPNASGRVTIKSLGDVENMHVEFTGMPRNTNGH